MSQPETTMPETATLKLLDRDIVVKRPKAIQLYKWQIMLDKVQGLGKAEWTVPEAIEMIDTATTIVKTVMSPDDRAWLDERMLYGDLNDEDVPEFLRRITVAFGAPEEEETPNRVTKRAAARRKPAKKTATAKR